MDQNKEYITIDRNEAFKKKTLELTTSTGYEEIDARIKMRLEWWNKTLDNLLKVGIYDEWDKWWIFENKEPYIKNLEQLSTNINKRIEELKEEFGHYREKLAFEIEKIFQEYDMSIYKVTENKNPTAKNELTMQASLENTNNQPPWNNNEWLREALWEQWCVAPWLIGNIQVMKNSINRILERCEK